jgi:acyl-CoA synthetase (AMP-forming)/AMP-acid ligase II
MSLLQVGSNRPGAFTMLNLLLGYIFRFVKLFQAFNRRLFNVRRPTHADTQHDLGSVHKSKIDGGPLLVGKSVFSYLERGLRKNPHGLAVISLHQPASHLAQILPRSRAPQTASNQAHMLEDNRDLGDCLTITYDQLHRGAHRLAAGLQIAGVRPESKMLMLIPNGGEYTLLMWCCIIMRVTYVCVDPDIVAVSGYDSLKDIVRSVKPSTVVVLGLAQAMAIDIAIQQLSLSPPLRVMLAADTANGWKPLQSHAVVPSAKESKELSERARFESPDRINSIIFTSGTSGAPKGCPLRVSSMCHILESQSWLITERNCRRALQTIHNSRGIAPFQTLQTWMAGGAVMMIKDSGNIYQMTEALRKHAPTFIAASAAMVTAVGQEMVKDCFLAKSVKRVQLGGEVIPDGALVECKELFPEAQVCINHGMTEGAGSFIWPFFETPAEHLPRYAELLPIGKAAPGSVIRVWDSYERRVAKRGHAGELHIQSGSLVRRYLRGECSESFINEGHERWFSTGDTAMIDLDGLVYILGRTKDMIVTKQGTIVPAAIEAVVRKLTGAPVSLYCFRMFRTRGKR